MTTWRQRYPLSRRKIIKKSIGQVLRMSIYALIGSIPYFLLIDWLASDGHVDRASASLTWFGFLTILVGWAPLVEYIYYKTYFYDADGQNVVIRKGIITQQEITLPFSKITDVYVDQDAGDVVLGLWDVHISTPTVSSGQLAHIDGVSRASATALREIILEGVNQADNNKEERTEKVEKLENGS